MVWGEGTQPTSLRSSIPLPNISLGFMFFHAFNPEGLWGGGEGEEHGNESNSSCDNFLSLY